MVNILLKGILFLRQECHLTVYREGTVELPHFLKPEIEYKCEAAYFM